MTTPARLRYRDVARDRPARGLVAASWVSDLGDYVGLAALMVLAFDASGSALGPAAVYGVKALPALLTGTVLSRWLDVPPRKHALVTIAAATSLLLAFVAAVPALPVALAVAGLMGGIRSANGALTAAALAEDVSETARQPAVGLLNVSSQAGQVIGFLTGGTVALLTSPSAALAFNATTALVAAVVLSRTPLSRGRGATAGQTAGGVPQRSSFADGLRIMWGHPVLRVVMLAAWAVMASSAVPESMSTSVAVGGWAAVVLASNAAGGVVGHLVAGRVASLVRPTVQLRWVAAAGCGFAAVAVAIALDAPPGWIVAGNALAGASGGWLVGGQAAVLKHAPVERMAQVNATMIAALIVLEGVGALAIAAVAVLAGAAGAYLLVAAFLLAAAGLLGPLARRGDAAEPVTPTVDGTGGPGTVAADAA